MTDPYVIAIPTGIVVVIVLLVVGVMVVRGLYWLADNAFVFQQQTLGTVGASVFAPRHQERTYDVWLNRLTTEYVPDLWSLQVDTPVGSGWFMMHDDPDLYFPNTHSIAVGYTIGRLSKKFSVLSLTPL